VRARTGGCGSGSSLTKYVKDKSSKESINTFDDVWLSRYPRPKYIGFDNGGEYKNVFEELVNNYGIKKKYSMPFNPQSNGIIERVHLKLNDSLITAEIDGREMDEKDTWGPFLSSAAYAICSTFHTTLKATPGQLVFGRDMVLPIKFLADWGAIEQKRQKLMGRNNRRENASRINHD
jgi:transposase InsO family protein